MPNNNTSNEALCPHCGNTIDHLCFTESVTSFGSEYGSCNFLGEAVDYLDSQVNNQESRGFEYSCPECEHSVYLDDFNSARAGILSERLRQARQEEESAPRDLEEGPTGSLVDPPQTYRRKQIRIYHCPDCKYSRELDEGEEAVICDRCYAEHAIDRENTDIY